MVWLGHTSAGIVAINYGSAPMRSWRSACASTPLRQRRPLAPRLISNYPWFHRLIKVSYARYDIRVVAVLFCRRRAATRLQNPTHLPLAIRPGQV